MKVFILLMTLFITCAVNSGCRSKLHSTGNELLTDKSKLEISGHICYTTSYYGGINRDYSKLISIPFQNYKMYVVSLSSADSLPVVVKSFTTDKKGSFTVSLPSGKYGFLTEEEVRGPLTKGQCLPKSTETKESHLIKSSNWVTNLLCPLEIKNNSIQDLIITNHQSVYCINCP